MAEASRLGLDVDVVELQLCQAVPVCVGRILVVRADHHLGEVILLHFEEQALNVRNVLVEDVFVERIFMPEAGFDSNEEKIASGLEASHKAMTAIEDLMGGNDYFAGPDLTLADLHAVPMVGAFVQAPEGAQALAQHPKLSNWRERMQQRESVKGIS